jgi:hypothetical protein
MSILRFFGMRFSHVLLEGRDDFSGRVLWISVLGKQKNSAACGAPRGHWFAIARIGDLKVGPVAHYSCSCDAYRLKNSRLNQTYAYRTNG